MNLGIIGAGRVGLSIGKYFSGCDSVTLTGYYSKTQKSAEEGAAFTGSSVFTSLRDIFEASDTLLIATPDDEIRLVWDCIVEECCCSTVLYDNKRICHCSGSLSSAVFSKNRLPVHGDKPGTGMGNADISVCSMHPMYAFHHKYKSYQQLNQVFFTLEGDEPAVAAFCRVLSQMGNHYGVIASENKIKYHCAASMASNLVIGLLSKSITLLTDCGFEGQAVYEMLEPLVTGNIENVFSAAGGVEKALTGPIERGDTRTVKKHLSVLDGEAKSLYQLLGKELADISARRHPDRDYGELLQLFDD